MKKIQQATPPKLNRKETRYTDEKGNQRIIKIKIRPVEPKILPLVKALNATKLLTTFSSCQGHYSAREQLKYFDRNFADVRFTLNQGIPESRLEEFLKLIIHIYWSMNVPVHPDAYKKIIPGENIYLITLTPKNRFDKPAKKRKDTDEAILVVTGLVRKWIKEEKTKQKAVTQ